METYETKRDLSQLKLGDSFYWLGKAYRRGVAVEGGFVAAPVNRVGTIDGPAIILKQVREFST